MTSEERRVREEMDKAHLQSQRESSLAMIYYYRGRYDAFKASLGLVASALSEAEGKRNENRTWGYDG